MGVLPLPSNSGKWRLLRITEPTNAMSPWWWLAMGFICIYPPSTQTVLCARSHSYIDDWRTTVLDNSCFEVYIISSGLIHTCISVTKKILNHGLKNLWGLHISCFLGVGIIPNLDDWSFCVHKPLKWWLVPQRSWMTCQLMGLKQTDSCKSMRPDTWHQKSVWYFPTGRKIPATAIMVVRRLLTIDCLLETHLLSFIVPPMISIGTLMSYYSYYCI